VNFDVKQIAEFKKVIEDIVDARLKSYGITSFVAAVVTKVNDDGTVNVTIPPDNSRFVNNVLNKSNESLSTGDSVELCTKNGRLSNAWVAIKHGKSVSGGSLEDRVKYLEDNALIFVKTGEYNG
jgi:hypothetical protein